MPRNRLNRAYHQHKQNARVRGIDFLLTFPEWLQIWTSSGHLKDRGVRKGQYVMARSGDKGPYAANNIRIILQKDNLAEMPPETKARCAAKIAAFQTGRTRSAETRAKMAAAKVGKVASIKTRRLQSKTHQKPLSQKQRDSLQSYWESKRGIKRPPEVGRKISASKLGKTKISKRQRLQISRTLTGRKHSIETIAKRVISLRAAWARRKAALAVQP